MKLLLTIAIVLSSSSAFAGKFIDKKKVKERIKFEKMGVKLGPGARIMLNQYLRKNKAKDKSFYSVKFSCEYLKSRREDVCYFSEVNFKKSK